MSANIDLVCGRCGITHTMKLEAHKKRIERKQTGITFCADCWVYPKQTNVDDLWQFVVTALRLTAR